MNNFNFFFHTKSNDADPKEVVEFCADGLCVLILIRFGWLVGLGFGGVVHAPQTSYDEAADITSDFTYGPVYTA